VEQSCPKEMAWKVQMYRGYLAVCNPEDFHSTVVGFLLTLVEKVIMERHAENKGDIFQLKSAGDYKDCVVFEHKRTYGSSP
jgi:hypothetical protein